MKVVAIIQARTGSTRLPGKVLMDISGQTMLERVIRRVQIASQIDEVVVASTIDPNDVAIAEEAARIGVSCMRGSEHDVLDRYLRAAASSNADVVVRITSDCPLIDPDIVDGLVEAFRRSEPTVDYCTNTLDRTYPRGLDAEVIGREALEYAACAASAPHQREHVTPYLYEHPDLFRLLSIKGAHDHSRLRWTVDVAEDLDFVRAIYERLSSLRNFGWMDVLTLLDREPGLMDLNRNVIQKPVH